MLVTTAEGNEESSIAVPPGVVITPKMGLNDLTSLSYDKVTAVLGIRE